MMMYTFDDFFFRLVLKAKTKAIVLFSTSAANCTFSNQSSLEERKIKRNRLNIAIKSIKNPVACESGSRIPSL